MYFPRTWGQGTVEESHSMGMLSQCQALQRCLFFPQLWQEDTIVPISYVRSLRLAWKGHGEQAAEASSSLEREEDGEPQDGQFLAERATGGAGDGVRADERRGCSWRVLRPESKQSEAQALGDVWSGSFYLFAHHQM